ncbi:MAG: hypothetical protein WCI57_05955 [Candidatus Berkelbacteria bacterium]
MTEEKDEKCECEGKDWKYECDGKDWKYKKWHHGARGGMKGGSFYGLAVIGVAIYYIQQVHGFWPVIVAILKAMVWPAFLLYKVFGMLHM